MRNSIETTIPLYRRILDDPDFQKGYVSTTFLERFLASYAPLLTLHLLT